MVSNNFALMLTVRVVVLGITLLGMAFAITATGYYSITTLLLLLATVEVFELYRYVSKTNAQLNRFLQAVRFDDFSGSFQSPHQDANFKSLAKTLDDIMGKINVSRTEQQQQLRQLKALIEHIPMPLLSLYSDDTIELHNNAARHLFASVRINKLTDLSIFGQPFADTIKQLEPGNRQLVNFSFDGIERQLTVVMSQIITDTMSENLISMQDIQSELDSVQLLAWQDLVRVLTHEIMNSITPVASLAKTASTDLVDDVRNKIVSQAPRDELLNELEDVRRAVDTLAKRAEGLMAFVRNYRSFTELPVPQKQLLSIAYLFAQLELFLKRNWDTKGINFALKVEPDTLQINADQDLLEQILINLLKNAEQALISTVNPQVSLIARKNQHGYVLIEVADNGPGIKPEIAKQIFVPFYTTKQQGSGVGLALTRQIMAAHGGSVTVGKSANGGAKFTLIF